MPDWRPEIARRLASFDLDPGHEAAVISELSQHLDQHYLDLLIKGIAEQDAYKAVMAGLDKGEVLGEFRRHITNREGSRPLLLSSSSAITSRARFAQLAAEFLNLETFVQDLRYGLRALRQSPGFAAIAILTIALGMGATTAIFSVVDATLLRPLPFPHPERLVSIEDDLPGTGAQDVGMSQPEWEDLQHSGIFENVSPTWFDENNLTGADRPARVRILIVAPNYFVLLGVKPQLGRTFNPQDHSPGLIPEVVISDGLWKRDFGSDPHVLDKSIRMDTDLYRIVGVMPPRFDAPGRNGEERNIEIWASTNFYGLPMPDHPPRNRRNLPTAVARLKDGVTLEEAQSRLDALVASLERAFPADYPQQSGWRVRVVPLKQVLVGNVRQSLILLLAAVTLVLLIACVNVANLLLARASTRTREIAIRQALGAGQPRLVRQLLTESLSLSVMGGIAGMALLFCTKNLLLRIVPENLPRLNAISINWTILGFAAACSLLAGMIFGLAPARHASRLDVNQALKPGGRSVTASGEQAHTRRLLVITEFALSMVLVISASLLLRSFWKLLNAQLGFNPENVVTVRTRLPYPNDPKIDKYPTPAQQGPFIRELLRRGQTLSGVQAVAMGDTASIPLDESQRELNIIVEGQFFFSIEGRDVQSDHPLFAEYSRVTPEYFQLLGIPLLRGRFFNDSDNDKAPQVAVVNEAFAQTYFPNQNPIGQAFKSTKPNSPWIRVVGVIANARTASLAQANVPLIYRDLYQTGAKHLAIFLRGKIDTGTILERLREQIESVDPTLPVFGAQTLQQTVAASLSERRFSMRMVALFALTALLLAALGIYGVISYIVSERTHEFGMRLALGADRESILRLVLREGLALALTGTSLGIAAGLLVSRAMASVLYGVKASDPLTFAAGALCLLGIAVIACLVPAWRATRVDPMLALRDA